MQNQPSYDTQNIKKCQAHFTLTTFRYNFKPTCNKYQTKQRTSKQKKTNKNPNKQKAKQKMQQKNEK